MELVKTLPWGRPLTRDELVLVPSLPGAKVELVDGSVIISPPDRGYTRADRDALPTDGRRHELVDGVLLMTPAPTPQHQFVLGALYVRLVAVCPVSMRVAMAPLDVSLGYNDTLQPDLLVALSGAFTQCDLPVAPLLAVEILSPSTRRIDLFIKKARYETAGCASYWVVDPIEARLIAWELRDGAYVEVADVSGAESWTATAPYAVDICPADLVR